MIWRAITTAAFAVCFVIVVILGVTHPDMTETRLAINFWPNYLLLLITGLCAFLAWRQP